jgi:hypothetical protein
VRIAGSVCFTSVVSITLFGWIMEEIDITLLVEGDASCLDQLGQLGMAASGCLKISDFDDST